MRVLIVSPGQDTGGQAFRIRKAFMRLTDWHVDAVHATDNYMNFPSHLHYDKALAQELYNKADIVHHKNGLLLYQRHDNGQRKPTVLHHQGSRLRGHPREVSDEGRSVGATQIVSTIDLLDDCKDAVWVPSPFDLDWIAAKYYSPQKTNIIRIAHSPTNRKIKATDDILAAVHALTRAHRIELDLIEKREWIVSLSRKGRAHIFVDQLNLGIGNSAIEAFAMGIPVVAGFAEPKDKERWLRITGESELPFYEATADNVEERLRDLIQQPDLRKEVGARGRAYAERWHSEEFCVKNLSQIYEHTPKSRGARYLRPFTAVVSPALTAVKQREVVGATR